MGVIGGGEEDWWEGSPGRGGSPGKVKAFQAQLVSFLSKFWDLPFKECWFLLIEIGI